MGLLSALGAVAGGIGDAGEYIVKDQMKQEQKAADRESDFQMQMRVLNEKTRIDREQKDLDIAKQEELRKKKVGAIQEIARGKSDTDYAGRLTAAEETYKAAGMADDPAVKASLQDAKNRVKGGLLYAPTPEDMLNAEADYSGDYSKAATLAISKADKERNDEYRRDKLEEDKRHHKVTEDYTKERYGVLNSKGGGAETKKAAVDDAVKEYNRALLFMKSPDPEGRAKAMLDGAVAKLASLGIKVGEKGDPLSSTVSAAKAILGDADAPEDAKAAARSALAKAVGSHSPESDKFVVGKKYRDGNGNVKTYKGNGQWA